MALSMLSLGLAGTVAPLGARPAGAAGGTPGTVNGTVFRDFNANGVMNTTPTGADPAVDLGVAGVDVRAYDASGALAGTATTAADGTYTLAYTTTDATTKVRIEFATPAGYQSGPRGTGAGVVSGTSVQFHSSGDEADYGIHQIDDYSGPDPVIVTPVSRGVTSSGDLAPPTSGTLYATNYAAQGDAPIGSGPNDLRTQATLEQTGNLWGLARYGVDRVFSAAMFKRHTPVGPGGMGAIYLTSIDSGSPNASLWTTIPNAGANPRGAGESDPGYDWFHDSAAWLSVGKIGLGDIELGADRHTLYAVNLADRQIYAVPVTPGATPAAPPTAGAPQTISLPLGLPGAQSGCAADAVRPFGLRTDSFGVWATLTCTGPTAADMRGYLYRYDEGTSSWDAAPAFEFGLAGPRGHSWINLPDGSADWHPWTDDFAVGLIDPPDGYSYPTPLVSDVSVDARGDLTIGIKDRTGDRVGERSGDIDDASNTAYSFFEAGDVLRACVAPGGWVLEQNGSCGGRAGAAVGSGNGPGGGEFYDDDYAWMKSSGWHVEHDQLALGGTEQVPGFADVLATAFDPADNVYALGYKKFSNADGTSTSGLEVTGDVRNLPVSCEKCVGTFGKVDGIGDLEAMLADAPIEIGNRVWLDTDHDGVQDAGEEPIAGVTVNLYDGSTQVGSVVTDGAGEYYFNDANVQGGLRPNTAYRVALDNPADTAAGGPLAGLHATVVDAGAPVGDAVDSDGSAGAGGVVSVNVLTRGPGDDDHTIDFGFVPAGPPFDLALRKRLAAGQASTVSHGSDVTFTIEVFNQGDVDATQVHLTDTLPAGTTLNDPDWVDGGDGTASLVLPGTLAHGASTTVDITVRVGMVVSPGPITNTVEISSAHDGSGQPVVDVDSTPDADVANDPLVDDVIDNTNGDEDDHDVASVTVAPFVFDLALRKTTTATQAHVGDLVPFDITVFNQGEQSATDVVVTDHVPAALSFDPADNPSWSLVGGDPTITIAGPIAPGDSSTVTIYLRVVATATRIENVAEISDATGPGGSTVTDVDSTPDLDGSNDHLVDDVIDNSGGDEDDHDVAVIGAPAFDLALRKTTTATQVHVGDVVPFDIEVLNQGEQSATDIVVTDTLPAGLTFDAADNAGWSLVAGQPTTTIAGPLAPGETATVTINLTVGSAGAGDLVNNAEISSAHDGSGNTVGDVDSTPDVDATNDHLVDDVIDNSGGDEDDHDVASVTVQPLVFDLALRKTSTATQVHVGDLVPFSIEVLNQGEQSATEIVVTDTLPAGLSFDPADNSGWALVGGQPTTTIAGPLAPGETHTVTINLRVNESAAATSVVNNAEISSAHDGSGNTVGDVDSTPDVDATNDHLVDDVIDNSGGDEDDHDVASVTVAPLAFDLALRKTTTATQVHVDDVVPFTIEVFNQGEVTASDVTVTDHLPAALAFDAADNPSWSLVGGDPTITIAGPIAPGDSSTVTISLRVVATATRIENVAEISDATGPGGSTVTDVDSTPDLDGSDDQLVDDVIDNSGGDEDDHDVAVIGAPAFDLALRKTVDTDVVARGASVAFGIEVLNQGEQSATDIVVTDTLPAGLSFDPADNPGWTLVDGKPTTTVVGPLAPGETHTVTINLTVSAASASNELVNTAEISSAHDRGGRLIGDVDSTPDVDATNDHLVDDVIDNTAGDEDDHDVAVVRLFDLALRKTTDSGLVHVGDLVPFEITVFNQGQVEAGSVSVTDFVPSQLSFEQDQNPAWQVVDGKPVIVLDQALAPGGSETVTINLRVIAQSPSIDNLAEISSATGPRGAPVVDVDSTSDSKGNNDVLVDDVIDNVGGDEDDHDVASIQAPVFDLALRKTLSAGQAATVWPGDQASFDITVLNQGDQAASDVVITDTPPSGLAFEAAANPGWTVVDGQPTVSLSGPLEPGDSAVVTLVLRVNADEHPGDLRNLAEISAATDEAGRPGIDVDSTADVDATNDVLVDDVVDNSGGDEDDHDVALVVVPTFDLALRKTLSEDQASQVSVGDQVSFDITVFNQGSVSARDIVITDTVPAGLEFRAGDNADWQVIDGKPSITVPGPIDPGEQQVVSIVLHATGDGSFTNVAEISDARDPGGVVRTDIDSTGDIDETNDVLIDDVVDNSGGDEDDHDVAPVKVVPVEVENSTTVAPPPTTVPTRTTVRRSYPGAALVRTGTEIGTMFGLGLALLGIGLLVRRGRRRFGLR